MGASCAQAPMRSRHPVARVRNGTTQQGRQIERKTAESRQAIGGSDPAGGARYILTGYRVARRYREDVRCFRDRRDGMLTLGRCLAGRIELSIEVDELAQGAGLGTALARRALRLVPDGVPIFAQVPPR